MIHSVPELKVSPEQAQLLGKQDEERLLSSSKLVLLVDLDQTLIHTTHHPLAQAKCKDVIEFRLYGSGSRLFTKLRPYTYEFLEKISKLYELHICTFGTRLYAHKIAEILDPNKKLFSHRILSRDECFDPNKKTGNLSALFPCGDSMVCIIDDREDVWNYQQNLILVKPYSFFRNTGDINSPNREKDDMLAKAAKVLSNKQSDEDEKEQENEPESGETEDDATKKGDQKKLATNDEQSKDETKEEKAVEDKASEKSDDKSDEKSNEKSDETDSNDDDDYLLYLLEILRKIHKIFYKEYHDIKKYTHEGEHLKIPPLKELIPWIRKQVLKGVHIVFTGLIPTKLPLKQSRMWELADQLGASVRPDLVKEGSPFEKTTHLIASNLNTAKVQEALKLKHVQVVSPLWLYACSQRWERVDERLFRLDKSDDFRNADKLKTMKLSFDEQLFLNYDLVKLSSLLKREKRPDGERSRSDRPAIEKLQIDKARQMMGRPVEPKADFTPFPVYDPLTGKLIRADQPAASSAKQAPQPTTSKQQAEQPPADEEENLLKDQETEDLLTPHSMLELNPLCAFSKQDLKMMDEEVDDACSDEDNEESELDELDDEEFEVNDPEMDDEENVEFDYGDEPRPKRCRREIEHLSGSSSEDASNLSFEDSNLGAQLEKDFLS